MKTRKIKGLTKPKAQTFAVIDEHTGATWDFSAPPNHCNDCRFNDTSRNPGHKWEWDNNPDPRQEKLISVPYIFCLWHKEQRRNAGCDNHMGHDATLRWRQEHRKP